MNYQLAINLKALAASATGMSDVDIKLLLDSAAALEDPIMREIEDVLIEQGTGIKGAIWARKRYSELTQVRCDAVKEAVDGMIKEIMFPFEGDDVAKIVLEAGAANREEALVKLVEIGIESPEDEFDFIMGVRTGSICHAYGTPATA